MAYRSSAIASAATGAITATPAGVQVGDYLGGLFTTDSALATVSLPSGWAQKANINHAAGTPDGANTWYADKVATGSDSFQFNDNSSSNRSLVTAAWSGRDTSNPLSTAPVTTKNTTANGNPFTATYNGIAASDGDDVGIFFFGDQTTAADRFVTAPPTNYTERQDGVAQDWVAAIGLDTRDNVSAGATGNFTSAWSTGPGFSGYGAVVVAIKVLAPAGGGQTPHRVLPGLPHAGPFSKPWLRRSHQPAYTSEQAGVPLIHQEQHTRESRKIRPGKGPFAKAWLQHRRDLAFSNVTFSTFSDSVTEATTPDETESAQAEFASDITEAAAPADTQSAQATFTSSVTEATSPTDTQDAAQTFPVDRSESVTPADSSDAVFALPVDITESVAPSDSASATLAVSAQQAESVTPADAQSAQATFASDRAEAVTPVDTESVTMVAGVAAQESTTPADTVSARATFASSDTESLSPTDVSDGALNVVSQTYNDSISESAAVTASQDAVIVSASRSRGRSPFAKFTPYAEAGVGVKPLTIAVGMRSVSASALDRSKAAAVSVVPVYGRFALRQVNAGGGAMVSVRPLSVYVSARVIDVGWTGVEVSTTVMPAARSSCGSVDVRAGCTVSTNSLVPARIDIKMLSAKAVRAVRNPTDEELATAALALLRAARRR